MAYIIHVIPYIKLQGRYCSLSVVVVQSLSHVWLFVTLWIQHSWLPCPSLFPELCSNSCPLSQWCHPTNNEKAKCTDFKRSCFISPGWAWAYFFVWLSESLYGPCSSVLAPDHYSPMLSHQPCIALLLASCSMCLSKWSVSLSVMSDSLQPRGL